MLSNHERRSCDKTVIDRSFNDPAFRCDRFLSGSHGRRYHPKGQRYDECRNESWQGEDDHRDHIGKQTDIRSRIMEQR